jgi:hypothetical protein
MTSVEYYRGQKATTYDISAESIENARIQFQTGEPTDDLAVLDVRKG